MNNFSYLRQARASHFQSIYVALLVSAVILLVDLIAKEDIFLKIILIFGLIIIAEAIYRKAIIQTQKPIIALGNAIGTLEKYSIVKDKDGKEWFVGAVSDFSHKEDKKAMKKK